MSENTSDNKGGGPKNEDGQHPNRPTEEASTKPPQRDSHHPKERWDTARGSEPATRGSARERR